MTEPKKRNSTSLMLLLLYALLIASLLVLTLAGARLYSDTMDARDAHAKQRSALSYIQSQTAACGGKGNIRLIDGPEGPAVCLREPESDFETRIYLYENALFSGDTLFNGSFGRYDFKTGSLSMLKSSIKTLYTLPEDTVVYPGHGEKTTIKNEKLFNPVNHAID